MILTDKDPMPYGKYKGQPMGKVPGSYLIWLSENDKCIPQIKEYVLNNMETLKSEAMKERAQNGYNCR